MHRIKHTKIVQNKQTLLSLLIFQQSLLFYQVSHIKQQKYVQKYRRPDLFTTNVNNVATVFTVETVHVKTQKTFFFEERRLSSKKNVFIRRKTLLFGEK